MSEIILSICIPTYNRGTYLNSNLQSIFKQIEGNSSVEVIVSDNQSTDHTFSVGQHYLKYNNFKYHLQEVNIGMSRNIMASVTLANGQFCWVIGDDDFILQGAISNILELIAKHKNIDFFYAKLQGFPMSEYKSYVGVFDTSDCNQFSINAELKYKELDKWDSLIAPKYSVAYMGELMAGIFRKNIWDSHEFNPKGDFLSNLDTSYPHCVVYANSFIGKKAIYIHTPVILALEGTREWIDRLGYIAIVILKDLLDLYKEKGVDRKILHDCYVEYTRQSIKFAIRYIYKKSQYKDKVSLSKYFKFILFNPFITTEAIYINMKYSLKGVVRKAFPNSYKSIKQFFVKS